MAKDDLTCVKVTENALMEFIERVAVAGGTDIRVSHGDRGWYVIYKSPFTQKVEEREPFCTPQMIAEADCDGYIAKCGAACHHKPEEKEEEMR